MNDDEPDEDFTARAVGDTLDIYECGDCGHRDRALLIDPGRVTVCSACRSENVKLFLRAPTRGQLDLLRAKDREWALTEQDPDWRERFAGDVDRAMAFYLEA